MLPESRFSVELLPTKIARQRVFAVMVEHVRLQLRVLDELLAADLALVVAAPGVSSNMAVEGLLGCEAVAALGTAVGTFASVDSSGKLKKMSFFSLTFVLQEYFKKHLKN